MIRILPPCTWLRPEREALILLMEAEDSLPKSTKMYTDTGPTLLTLGEMRCPSFVTYVRQSNSEKSTSTPLNDDSRAQPTSKTCVKSPANDFPRAYLTTSMEPRIPNGPCVRIVLALRESHFDHAFYATFPT